MVVATPDVDVSSYIPPRAELVPTSEIRADPDNPRTITVKRFDNLSRRIMRDPAMLWTRPILAQGDGTIYAGNMRREVVERLWRGKRPKAQPGEVLPDWPRQAALAGILPGTVPAVVEDVDPVIAQERAIADNNHWGEFDEDKLNEQMRSLAEDGGEIASLGFDDKTLRSLLNGDGLGTPLPPPDDDLPDLPDATVTVAGDVWQMGPHRLVCGDSTQRDVIERLLAGARPRLGLSDPPYNVGENYDTAEDNKSEADYASFGTAWYNVLAAFTVNQIITPGWNNLAWWCSFKRPRFVAPWTKTNSMTRGIVSRFTCWEPIVFYGEKWKRERANDVYDFPISTQYAEGIGTLTGLHPCPKPLKMWVDLIVENTDKGDEVLDLFGGTGTTIVACEATERVGYACEMDLGYCDLILLRYMGLTGNDPIRERDGASFKALREALAVSA